MKKIMLWVMGLRKILLLKEKWKKHWTYLTWREGALDDILSFSRLSINLCEGWEKLILGVPNKSFAKIYLQISKEPRKNLFNCFLGALAPLGLIRVRKSVIEKKFKTSIESPNKIIVFVFYCFCGSGDSCCMCWCCSCFFGDVIVGLKIGSEIAEMVLWFMCFFRVVVVINDIDVFVVVVVVDPEN